MVLLQGVGMQLGDTRVRTVSVRGVLSKTSPPHCSHELARTACRVPAMTRLRGREAQASESRPNKECALAESTPSVACVLQLALPVCPPIVPSWHTGSGEAGGWRKTTLEGVLGIQGRGCAEWAKAELGACAAPEGVSRSSSLSLTSSLKKWA